MKTLYILAILALGGSAAAQGLSATGGTFILKSGILQVNGDLRITGGTFANDGNLFLTGNLHNDQVMTADGAGSITLKGIVPQTVDGGSAYFAHDLTIDNPAGIVLNNTLRAGGTVNFTNGIVTAANSAAPLAITGNGSVTGVSDTSHVDGYVVREGLGSFTYPVGNAAKYQPVTVDLTENSNGMLARYVAADAGTGTFGTTGASAVALEAYNNEEYWDISPIGSATGKVTISWDDFRNPSITASENVNVFSVAHLTGGNWLNEGSNASGILAAGSVTSEAISSWSPFTLGAIPGAGMPVTMVGFDGRIVENGALLEWQTTSEANASHFEVERSTDARTFQKIGSVVATGYSSGPQRYSFVDKSFGSQRQTVYYRLRSVDFDGTFSLTRAISLKPESNAGMAGVYPNPAGKSTSVTVTSRVPADKVSLWDLLGRQIPVRTSQMPDGSVQVGLTGVVPGAYVLKVATGHGTESRKLIIE